MDEIKLLASVYTKDEIVSIVNEFGIKVNGFQINFERAPIETLRAYLIKELKLGLAPKRKGRKYSTIPDVYNFISSSFIRENPIANELSMEELGVKAEMDLIYSRGVLLSLLYTNFPFEFDKYKEQLFNNVVQEEPVLKGIIKKTTVEEKMQFVKDRILSREMLYDLLREYISQVETKRGIDFYKEIHYKVNRNNQESFVEELFLTPQYLHHILMLAFIVEENRYLDEKYSYLLQYVIRSFNEQKKLEMDKVISEIEEETRRMKNEYNLLNGENESLKTEIEKHIDYQGKYEALNLENSYLNDNLTQLKIQKKTTEPFLRHFKYLLEKHQVIIVTSDIELFYNTEFQDNIEDVTNFNRQRKEKSMQKYKGKILFISRTSFSSTTEWLVAKRSLEKNNLLYHEIIGYEMDDYIKQTIEILNGEGKRVY